MKTTTSMSSPGKRTWRSSGPSRPHRKKLHSAQVGLRLWPEPLELPHRGGRPGSGPGHRENGIPLDSIYLDIDYMKDYRDFTVDPEKFPDLQALAAELAQDHIHLVPIIDAGVKIEPATRPMRAARPAATSARTPRERTSWALSAGPGPLPGLFPRRRPGGGLASGIRRWWTRALKASGTI